MARSQYALPTDRSDPRGKAALIRETARKYGIDPEVAVKVAKSEGLRDFSGDGGKSGGAFQLYTGGGLGNKFKKETGLDPLDPKNEDATIDYALKYASQHGWGSWYGAPKVGVGTWDGISGGAKTETADAASGYPGIGSDAAASERAATQVKGTDVSTATPETGVDTSPAATGAATSDFLDRLKNSKAGMEGVGEAFSGLGQAVTGGGGKGLYDTSAARPAMPAPALTSAAMVPTVNPQAAEQQRQQLALAMQRLNSGKLY